jgi:hypothetical protein
LPGNTEPAWISSVCSALPVFSGALLTANQKMPKAENHGNSNKEYDKLDPSITRKPKSAGPRLLKGKRIKKQSPIEKQTGKAMENRKEKAHETCSTFGGKAAE